MTGYRRGMSSTCVIGRKLGALYEIPSDMKNEIESLLTALDSKLSRAR